MFSGRRQHGFRFPRICSFTFRPFLSLTDPADYAIVNIDAPKSIVNVSPSLSVSADP